MKILILGTSNSVMHDGWTCGLRAALPEASILNRSIGGSPGIQFLSLVKQDFSLFDLVIFDSVPNDEEYEMNVRWGGDRGYSAPAFIDELLFRLCATIRRQTTLVILGISLKRFSDQPSDVFLRRKALAVSLDSEFVDFSAVLRSHARSCGVATEAFYDEHPSHPNRALACKIGYLMGLELGRMSILPPVPSLPDFYRTSNRSKPMNFLSFRPRLTDRNTWMSRQK